MKFLRILFIAGFGCGLAYHMTMAFIPKVGNTGTGERHLVFLAINFVGIILMSFNHPKSLLVFIPLIIQQLYSHGLFLWQEWDINHVIDWPSVIVLIGMPALGFYIYRMNRKSVASSTGG